MTSSFDFSEPILDFDSADIFLSTLLSTVPTLDREQSWDLDVPDLGNLAYDGDAAFNQLGLQNDLDYLLEMADPSFIPEFNARPLLSLTSYSDLIVSGAGTPGTNPSLAHPLPSNVKREPVDFGLYSTILDRASSEEAPSADVVSPKTRPSATKVSKPTKKTKVSHNMIEKKYRTNINSKILELRDAVPTLRIASGKADVTAADLEGLTPASKLNKASVLTKATEYIRHLERKIDVMQLQIQQFQTLIHEAGDNTMAGPMSDSSFPAHGFGFNPQQSYNTTSAEQYQGMGLVAQNSPQNMGRNSRISNNMMLGGLATVMGTSVLSNDNFRGMAALPFMPPSFGAPATLHLLTVVRTALVLFGLYTFVQPLVSALRATDEKGQVVSVWLSWLLVTVGIQLPKPLSELAKDLVVSCLLGKQQFSTYDLVEDYVALSSSDVSYETCLLNVLVGALLIKKFPLASKMLRVNMRLKGSLLMKLDHTGDNVSLRRISQLIKTVDGVSMFESDALLLRLLNLATGRTLNLNINNGENHLTYIELYLLNKTDLYAILFNWRVFELVHQLNMSYLDALSANADLTEDSIESIKKDTLKIDKMFADDSPGVLVQYFTLFKCVLFPESTPQLIKTLKTNIVDSLTKVKASIEGPELTDDEVISEDESQLLVEELVVQGPLEMILEQKSLVYSMNLMNEEKFIVVASSLICYYLEKKEEDKLRALLHYLKFDNPEVPLSLLSFTCLVKVVCLMVRPEDEEKFEKAELPIVESDESAVLELLVKAMRGWLNNDNKKSFMSHQFRSDLSDLVIARGMTLNEI